MAYTLPTNFSLSMQCDEDLSNNQYFFVTLNSNQRAIACDATHKPVGILTNVPSVGARGQYSATVDVAGVSKITTYGIYPVMTVLVPGVDGTYVGVGMTAADASTSYNYARAITLQPSVAAYDTVSCMLLGPQAGIDASATA